MNKVIAKFAGDYDFLSNFYYSPLEYNSIEYPTAEHAYQAQKTLDEVKRQNIAKLPSAGLAKSAGRKLKIRPDWENVKISVMEDILRIKFKKGTGLAERLKQTSPAFIEEGNTWGDKYWGKCNGAGLNMLGRLLMRVRYSLL
jgi:ribA/ribD-fused uncharacterized protein